VTGPLQAIEVRASNRHSVYRALAAGGEPTRAELSSATGLSVPTVSTIVSELIAAGVATPAGTANGTGGRPARRVRFAPNARHVLAVDLSGERARACRVDLRGEVVHRAPGPVLEPGGTSALLDWLAPMLRDDTRPPVRRLALAVPGVVDARDGHVDLAPALGWDDHAVAELFETALGTQVVLENDVNALALAELHYGVGSDLRHVLYVAIGSGVGAGLVIDGRLYRGANAAAGEIGYSLPLHSGDAGSADAAPHQRGPGPLEQRLIAAARRCQGRDGRLDRKTAAATGAFLEMVETLGPVLHNLACVLDPELLVVAWPADPEGQLAKHLRDAWRGPWHLPIEAGRLGSDGAARGVARLALEHVEREICRVLPSARPTHDDVGDRDPATRPRASAREHDRRPSHA
jgi:predicted NBD/HSP70 family sugar kinase